MLLDSVLLGRMLLDECCWTGVEQNLPAHSDRVAYSIEIIEPGLENGRDIAAGGDVVERLQTAEGTESCGLAIA